MEMYTNDEKNFYSMVAMDMLKDAWNRYGRTVSSVTFVLRKHGFTEEEIQKLIEDSRS